MRSPILLLLPASCSLALALLEIRDTCADGYTVCAPEGATTTDTPQIGDAAFQHLFVDIVNSDLPSNDEKRHLSSRDSVSLCCVASLSCMSMSNLDLPFCYDSFTTNYFLPDGAYGTVVGGAYKSATDDVANLETGDYTLANGTTGNIYASDEAAVPNTSTLAMPSQFTGTGIGSAIPGSALGAEVTITFTTTYSSTLTPTTVQPSTVAGTTVSASTIEVSTLTTEISSSTLVSIIPATTYEPSTIAASTVAGTTVSQTTVVAITKVQTTTIPATAAASPASSGASTSSASASTSKGSASSYAIQTSGLVTTFAGWLSLCLAMFI